MGYPSESPCPSSVTRVLPLFLGSTPTSVPERSKFTGVGDVTSDSEVWCGQRN